MRLSLVLLLLTLTTGLKPVAAQTPAEPNPALEPILAFLNAVAKSDVDGMVAAFHEDATVFMPSGQVPHRLKGRDDMRKAFGTFLKQLRLPAQDARKPDDAQLQQLGDVAIVTFHLGALPGPHDAHPTTFSRRTFVVSKGRDGKWLVSHLHASDETVPPPNRNKTLRNR